MSELRDRLEALATRGTRRGADEVLNAAQREAQTGAADEGTDVDGYDLPIIDDDLPIVSLEPRVRRRRRWGSFVASAGIAALVGVGALAITAMLGSGGASSPEAAVRQLADAVNNKDALAAVDVLVPSEVRSMRQTVKHATDRAAELKIVNEAGKPLEGVDLSVDHLELRTEPLADGYAKVVITSGFISADTHREQLSALLQKATRRSELGSARGDLTEIPGDSGLPTFVVVVRQNGGWYVSPAYTALEYIREINDYPAADFGSGKAAELGAATPEDAVKDALHAWQSANWDRLIALAPPDELPLYDYRAMINASATDAHPEFSIDNLSTTATVNGDSAVVKLDASGMFGSDPVRRWQVGGTCPANSMGWFGYSESYDESSSAGSTIGLCLAGDVGQSVPFGFFTAGLASSGASTSGPVSIEVVREDGRWFVSPISTALDVLDSAIQHVDQRSVYTLLGIAYDLPPDGTITLGQPFDVPSAATGLLSSRVYRFEGEAGQEVIGEMKAATVQSGLLFPSDYANGTIYDADGNEVGYVEFQSVPTAGGADYFYASTARLPKTGTYTLVLQPFWAHDSDSITLTLWDLARAPKELRDAAQSDLNVVPGECTASSAGGLLGGSSESCVSSATPTTVSGSATPDPLGSAFNGGEALGPCTVTGGTLKCGDVTIGRVCPAGTSPSTVSECIPPEVVDQFKALQSQLGSDVSVSETTVPATFAPTSTATANSTP